MPISFRNTVFAYRSVVPVSFSTYPAVQREQSTQNSSADAQAGGIVPISEAGS